MDALRAYLLWPEYILVLGLLFLLLREIFTAHPASKFSTMLVTLVTLLLTAVALFLQMGRAPTDAFYGLVALDPFSSFTKILTVLSAATVMLMMFRSTELKKSHAEFFSMVLAVVFGSFLMISAKNLLIVYLSMETMSIISYLLAGMKKEDAASNEAALKYVVYGSLASGVMIFGMSYLYGVTGSLDFTAIHAALMGKAVSVEILWLSLALIFVGFGYKISAAPFHMWTPDIYEGSPLVVTAFFSVVPKTAAVAALIRFLYSVFSHWDATQGVYLLVQNVKWGTVLATIGVITMFVGNLAALQQSNIKRLLAYSSISHAGFLLLGISAMSSAGISAALFYLVIYYLMNLGAFWIACEVSELTGSEAVDDYRGLASYSPVAAILMLIFLFSLTGLPPFAGFISKWYIFSALINQGMTAFALVAVLNTVIALFYYAKIVRLMFFDRRPLELAGHGTGTASVVGVSTLTLAVGVALAVPNVLLGLYWEPVYRLGQSAAVFFGVQ